MVKFHLFPQAIFFSELTISKLKEFAVHNFKFDENGIKFSTWKRRNYLLLAISPFPIVFSNDSYRRHIKHRACLAKG